MVLSEIASLFFEWSQETITTFGYLGVFLVSLVGSASIIFPVPSFLIIITAGSLLNPWLLGISAGLGSAIGEFTGYLVGRGGREIIEKKHKKSLEKAKKWIERHGAFPIIVFFAATPLPDDIVGILSGIIVYNPKKFFAAVLIGKIVLSTALAWAGFYGINWVLDFLG